MLVVGFQKDRAVARLRVGDQRLAGDLALGRPVRLRDDLHERDGEGLAGRLPLSVTGTDASLKRFAIKVNVSIRRHVDRERAQGQPDVGHGPDGVLGKLADDPQSLLLREPFGGELERELARDVRRSSDDPAVGELHDDRAAGGGSAILIAGLKRA